MKVIKLPLSNITNKTNIKKINELVYSVNKSTILAYQFFKLYALKLLDNSLNLPNIDNKLFESIFRVISKPNTGKGKRSINPLESELNKFFRNEFLNKKPHKYIKTKITLNNNSKLNVKLITSKNINISLINQENIQQYTYKSNVFKYAPTEIVTSIKNNIILHFGKHLYHFIYFLLKYNQIINDIKKNDLKYIISGITASIYNKIEYKDKNLDENIIENINSMIQNDPILYELYFEEEYVIENKLKQMYKMAKFRENNNDQYKLLSVFPQRDSIIPKHITIDFSVLNESFMDNMYRKNMKEIISKYDMFKIFFPKLDKIKYKKDYKFNFLKTDGYSASIIFKHKDEKESRFIKKNENKEYYTESKIKLEHITDLNKSECCNIVNNYKILGIDPGKTNILAIVDNKGNTLNYTSKQRRVECGYIAKFKKFEKLKEELNIIEEETRLSQYNSKTMDYNKYKEYITEKNKSLDLLNEKYKLEIWRKYNLKTHIKTKQSEAKLIKNIKTKFGENLCLLVGDWSRKTQMKRCVPSPNIGIKRLLKQHYETHLVDEYKTSKLCYNCEKETKNMIIEGIKKHGLLRCTNVKCMNKLCSQVVVENLKFNVEKRWKHRLLNRDVNGACNILKIGLEVLCKNIRPLNFRRLKS
jgi:hypothetical protein